MSSLRPFSKEEINELPPLDWEGEIIEIVTPEGTLKALDILSTQKVVGFDTETRPAFVKGESYTPALLQLATLEQAFIFRLKFFTPPKELEEFLGNEDVLKVGVAPRDDVKGLQKIMQFEPKGFVDLALEARARGIPVEGLRPLCGYLLGKRLMKGERRTNWARTDLTPKQIRYAALDAVSGLMVYQKMMEA